MNWQEVTLKDVSSHVDYGYTASAASQAVGPKFLRITDIVPELVDWEAVPYCEIEGKKLDKYQLEDGDIVVARTGATTGYAKCLRHPPVSVFASYLVRFRLSDQVNKRFVGHVIQSQTYKDFIKRNVGGAAQPNANAQVLGSFPFKLPPLPTQQRIAAILTAYDDLIENNTRRIAILEEMARRLYEEWFVHFRFPGHDEMEFRETDRGQVPQGWNWVPLSKMYETSAGGTPSRKKPEFYGGSVRWVKSKELRDAPIFGTEEMITEEGLRKSSAKLFPQTSVLIAMYGATIGQLGVLRAEAATNQAVCAVLPAREAHGWAYAFLSILARRSELIDLRAGAAQQNVSQAIIKRFPMLHADHETHSLFEAAVKPLLGLSFALHRKNANLRAQRDLLLPKLVSGEIDVSQTEATLEAAE